MTQDSHKQKAVETGKQRKRHGEGVRRARGRGQKDIVRRSEEEEDEECDGTSWGRGGRERVRGEEKGGRVQ